MPFCTLGEAVGLGGERVNGSRYVDVMLHNSICCHQGHSLPTAAAGYIRTSRPLAAL